MMTPSRREDSADCSESVPAPRLGVGPHRGRQRSQPAGSCLMEYVSTFAGERFSDLPTCTHPAVAVVAWRINDELGPRTRQQLISRAPTLLGAGRGLNRPVRPIVLGTITDAALALDPDDRYFGRLQRRLDHPRPGHYPRGGTDDTSGRVVTWWHHLVPVNVAMTHLLMSVYRHSAHRDQREQRAIDLLDDCLAAVQSSPASPEVSRPAVDHATEHLDGVAVAAGAKRRTVLPALR